MLGRILQDSVAELRVDILARELLHVDGRRVDSRVERRPRAVEVVMLRDLYRAVAQVDGEVVGTADEVVVPLD